MTFRPDAFWPTLEGALEDEYRVTTQARERQVVLVGAAAVLTASLAFTVSDWLLALPGDFPWPLAAARSVLAVLALCVFVVFWARPHRRQRDAWVTAMLFGLVAVDASAAFTHGDTFWANFVLSPMLVLAIYVTLAATARASMAAALLDTAASLVVAFGFRTLSGPELLTIVLTFAFANLLGIVLLQWLRRSGRAAFLALRAERASKQDLKKAVDEIATLRGIVPICSACKKVRDDEGFWHQVEIYVQERSEAQFSHGLCPTCVPEYFGDVMDG